LTIGWWLPWDSLIDCISLAGVLRRGVADVLVARPQGATSARVFWEGVMVTIPGFRNPTFKSKSSKGLAHGHRP
jgi:hypothetical protein